GSADALLQPVLRREESLVHIPSIQPRSRDEGARRADLHPDRRLERAEEPSLEVAEGERRLLPTCLALGSPSRHDVIECREVELGGDGEVLEALGDRPAVRAGLPVELLIGQSLDEGGGGAADIVELTPEIVEDLGLRNGDGAHVSPPFRWDSDPAATHEQRGAGYGDASERSRQGAALRGEGKRKVSSFPSARTIQGASPRGEWCRITPRPAPRRADQACTSSRSFRYASITRCATLAGTSS